MERTIPTANIFPPGDPAKEDPLANTDPEFDIDLENYATVREKEEDTTIEIDRVIKRKFVERVDKKTVARSTRLRGDRRAAAGGPEARTPRCRSSSKRRRTAARSGGSSWI